MTACALTAAYAEPSTKRIPQFTNEKVSVWETIVYSTRDQELKSHRHEHDRVLVALTDGVLKITNNKGQTHELKLKKDQAYYLKRDVDGEFHTDENISGHPIKVMVIELQS